MKPASKKQLSELTAFIASMIANETPEQKAERLEFEANEANRPLVEQIAEDLHILQGCSTEAAELFAKRTLGLFKSKHGRDPKDFIEWEEWVGTLEPNGAIKFLKI